MEGLSETRLIAGYLLVWGRYGFDVHPDYNHPRPRINGSHKFLCRIHFSGQEYTTLLTSGSLSGGHSLSPCTKSAFLVLSQAVTNDPYSLLIDSWTVLPFLSGTIIALGDL